MKILTNKRHEYIQALQDILPTKILAPFGFKLFGFEDYPLQIIVNDIKYMGHISPKWQIKTNKKLHAKIALGPKGFLIGSWNFTENSTYNLHEASVMIEGFCPELNDYFEELWARSKEVKYEYTGTIKEG